MQFSLLNRIVESRLFISMLDRVIKIELLNLKVFQSSLPQTQEYRTKRFESFHYIRLRGDTPSVTILC